MPDITPLIPYIAFQGNVKVMLMSTRNFSEDLAHETAALASEILISDPKLTPEPIRDLIKQFPVATKR